MWEKESSKMKKKVISGLLISIIMSTVLAGCGSSSKSSEAATDAGSYYMESDDFYMNSASKVDMSEESALDYDMDDVDEGAGAEIISETPKDSRKLIKNVSADVETEQFDDFMAQIESKTKALGGYIESNYTYNGRNYHDQELKNANLVIRIPAANLDEFMSNVAEKSNVINKNETVRDVTLQYVDLETHKKTLKAEQNRLLEMMNQTESIEEMIMIESRLSEVSYELESQEEQIRALDNQINYSTISLDVNEVKKYTPAKEQSFWQKIGDGFSENFVDVVNGIVAFIIWFITSIPHLVVWGLIILGIVKCISKTIADYKERKARGIDKKTQKAERKALKKKKREERKNAKIESISKENQ